MSQNVNTRTTSAVSVLVSNVRAELGRRGLTLAAIAPVLGVSRDTAYRRMRGDLPFTTDELEALAAYFEIDPGDLFAPARHRGRAAVAA